MADLLSKGFSLNIKYMEDNDIRDFAHSLLLSVVGTIILCFFLLKLNAPCYLYFYNICTFILNNRNISILYNEKYKNWNVFTR